MEIVDSGAIACKSGYGELSERVSTGSEHTDGSECQRTSAGHD